MDLEPNQLRHSQHPVQQRAHIGQVGKHGLGVEVGFPAKTTFPLTVNS